VTEVNGCWVDGVRLRRQTAAVRPGQAATVKTAVIGNLSRDRLDVGGAGGRETRLAFGHPHVVYRLSRVTGAAGAAASSPAASMASHMRAAAGTAGTHHERSAPVAVAMAGPARTADTATAGSSIGEKRDIIEADHVIRQDIVNQRKTLARLEKEKLAREEAAKAWPPPPATAGAASPGGLKRKQPEPGTAADVADDVTCGVCMDPLAAAARLPPQPFFAWHQPSICTSAEQPRILLRLVCEIGAASASADTCFAGSARQGCCAWRAALRPARTAVPPLTPASSGAVPRGSLAAAASCISFCCSDCWCWWCWCWCWCWCCSCSYALAPAPAPAPAPAHVSVLALSLFPLRSRCIG
jgi:hypothetical protein